MTSRERLIEAIRRGYCVDENGQPFGPRGKLSDRITSDGYRAIALRIAGRPQNVGVHRIAAYQLFGERIFDVGIEVRHLNGNPIDNSAGNLALGTCSQNCMDKPTAVRLAAAKNAAQYRRRLTDDEVAVLRIDRENGMTFRQLAYKYSISVGAAHYIVDLTKRSSSSSRF